VLIVLGLNSFRLKKKPIRRHRLLKIKTGLTEQELQHVLAAMRAYRAAHPEAAPISITCLGRHDGAGAQALAVVSTLLWAEATGCRYLHTPFAQMAHRVDATREEWAARWERFLNLGHGERRVQRSARIIPARDLLTRPETLAKPRTVVAAPYFHWREFQAPGTLERLRPLLRRKYSSGSKSGVRIHRGAPGSLMMAIHVRRGDITEDRRDFYTHNDLVMNTIEGVRAVARDLGRTLHLNLFSEGPEEMFAPFAAAGCTLHLDRDPFEAFHNMVSADILVQAKSSFSYLAGMISTGIVLHERYATNAAGEAFYRHAPDWIVRDGTGAFDREALRQRLLSSPRPAPRAMNGLRRWLSLGS
jgi:hypothetical protein